MMSGQDSYSDDKTLGGISKDAYFLNVQDAFRYAEARATTFDAKSGFRLLNCYYAGPIVDSSLENLIWVAIDDIVEIFTSTELPIPQLIVHSGSNGMMTEEMPADIIEEIKAKRTERNRLIDLVKYCPGVKKLSDFLDRDTYYLDPKIALNNAKQKRRVFCGHPTIDGLQICFYRGSLPEYAIENLVHVELDEFVDFFTKTSYRIPEKIQFPANISDELKNQYSLEFNTAIDLVKRRRFEISRELIEISKSLKPAVNAIEPLRVYIPTSRYTTVMQYCSKNVAKEFEKRGFKVLVHIENNEMCDRNPVDFLKKYIEFNPHITFYVNELSNHLQGESVVNISWWQDLMPRLKNGSPFECKKNDFIFSYSSFIDKYLNRCGINSITRQFFAIDDEVFRAHPAEDRQNKIVFVGSSYWPSINLEDDKQRKALNRLFELMCEGVDISDADIVRISEDSELGFDFVFWKLFHYVVRDYSVQWLCKNQSIPVEVYGRFWDRDAEVAKYFKGELKHGGEVASIYNSAKYALVCHPFEINSQRLVEVAACGCIPIVYDCRNLAEEPYWSDYCLFYKNEKDLLNILNNRLEPEKDPLEIVVRFTYQSAVGNFIEHSGIKFLLNEKNKLISDAKTHFADAYAYPDTDAYFTDISHALRAASRQLVITDKTGRMRPQYCYYDGPLTDSILINLICVPKDKFTEFFVNNELPIPVWLVNELGEIHNLSKEPDFLKEIESLRQNNPKPVLHEDTDYFDALEALNVAKQKNSRVDEEGHRHLQICYYHTHRFDCELENLVFVDLENLIDFFVNTRMRQPKILQADAALRPDYDLLFAHVAAQRGIREDILKQQAKACVPAFAKSGIKVLFLVRNSESDLFKIKKKLSEQGFDSIVYVVESALYRFNPIDFLQYYIEYRPDIVIQDNYLYSDFMHDGIVNAVYWHSDASQFERKSTLPSRCNDFYVCFSQSILKHLKRCGARNVVIADTYNLSSFSNGLYSSWGQGKQVIEYRCIEWPIIISSLEEYTIASAVRNFNSNLTCLRAEQNEIYKHVVKFLNENTLQFKIDHFIDGIFFTLAGAVNGVESYRMDLSRLSENSSLIKSIQKENQGRDVYGYALCGIGAGYELLQAFELTMVPVKELTNIEIPLFVIEQELGNLILAMVVNDLCQVISEKRVRWFIGGQALEKLKAELEACCSIIPEYFVETNGSTVEFARLQDCIHTVKAARKQSYQMQTKQIAEYYALLDKDLWCKKLNEACFGSLKVMALTTRFSSFLQYCIRDFMDGFAVLGAKTRICIESENYERINIETIISNIADFKPDLIICIDHFRYEYQGIPDSIPFITWIQDMLPNITENSRTPGYRDFVFVFAKKWLSLNTLAVYKDNKVDFLPLGYNARQYYPLEDNLYDCDVLVVTHLESPEKTFEPIRNPDVRWEFNFREIAAFNQGLISEAEMRYAYSILESHCRTMDMAEFEEFCVIHPQKTINDFTNIFLSHGLNVHKNIIETFLPAKGNRLHSEYLNRMKMWPVELLLASECQVSMHLYGKNWEKYEHLKMLAKGIADNGHILNVLMNRSKICINSNPGVSLHMRTMEIIASGTFMLTRKMHYDGSPISDFFNCEEIVLYHDENDFIEKVFFYLKHSDERQKISGKALIRLKENFSYSAIAKRSLLSIRQRLAD